MRPGLCSAAVAVSVLFGVHGASADWPGYRGENGAGIARTLRPPRTLDAETAKVAWRATPGESFSEFAVSGGKALVFALRDGGESVVCMDAWGGMELWVTVIDEKSNMDGNGKGPRATPAIAGDKVYAYGSFMKLVCLELETGKEVWKRDIKTEYAGRNIGWGPAASALIVDNLVVVVGGGPGRGILAFDRESGKEEWGVTDDVHTHATPTVATIGGQKQIICFMQSGLVSVEPEGGKVLWRLPVRHNTSTAASPVVGGKDGDIVFCSAGYGVGATACRVAKEEGGWTAKQLWSNGVQNHWASGVHRDGYIYCLDGFKNSKCPLICLDIETGATVWSQPDFGSQGGLILVGDTLVVQAPSGDLVVAEASPAAYEELGRMQVFQGRKCWVAPSFSDGMIFTRSTTESACVVPAAE